MRGDYETLRPLALKLRGRGLTLTEIVAELNTVPKGTVYHWIKDCPTKPKSRKPNTVAATKATVAKWESIRQVWAAQAEAVAPQLLCNQLFRDFIALFAGEGSRKEQHSVSLVNTDPFVIRATFKAMAFLPNGGAPKLALRLYPDHVAETEVAFWRYFLRLRPDYSIAVHVKPSSGLKKELHTCTHGIMRVSHHSLESKIIVDRCLHLLREQWLAHP